MSFFKKKKYFYSRVNLFLIPFPRENLFHFINTFHKRSCLRPFLQNERSTKDYSNLIRN